MWRPGCASRAAGSHAEREAGSDVGRHQLARHASAHGVDKVCAGAVHGDDDVRFERFELGHRLVDVVLRRGDEMESADDRMQLRDPDTAIACLMVLISPT